MKKLLWGQIVSAAANLRRMQWFLLQLTEDGDGEELDNCMGPHCPARLKKVGRIAKPRKGWIGWLFMESESETGRGASPLSLAASL